MHFLKTTFAISLLCAATALPTFAQDANPTAEGDAVTQITDPNGNFVDEFGTSFAFSLCGEGTELCGILTNVEGKSRTEENLAYLNEQVIQASQTAPNEWKGTVIFDGSEAAATITQTSADSIEVEGCRGILCQTLVFSRV